MGYGAFGHVRCAKVSERKTKGTYAIKTQRLKGSELTPEQANKERAQQEAIKAVRAESRRRNCKRSCDLQALTKLTEIIVNASPKKGEFRLYNGRQVRRAVSETEILEYVKDCPFVITKHSDFIDGQEIFLVTDLIEGGSLERYLRTRKNSSLTEEEARFYSAEIVVALMLTRKM